MTSSLLYYLASLISLTISMGPTGDLTCNAESWTVVSAEWSFKQCVIENTDAVNGAMSWIGEAVAESLDWSDYTVEATMTPLFEEMGGGANGGLAFNIQEVAPGGTSGKYYAISIFPKFAADQIEIHLGKWNNHYDTVGTWFMDDVWVPGQPFLIKAVISTKINVTIDVYVDNNYLGRWIEDKQPMFKHGSIGMRNYLLPANFTSVCVNGCVFPDDEARGNGGWIFIGILMGGLFLYCLTGYIINGAKSKNYGDVKGNIPHLQFWKTLPRLVMVGCQVSVEITRAFLCKRVGDKERLMETAGDNEYDASDQDL